MGQLNVELGERSYPIFIGAEILDKAGNLVEKITRTSKIFLVSNPTVYNLYGAKTVESIEKAGFSVTVALMPDGETYKNIAEAMKIFDKAVDAQLERGSMLVALGGGVTGDLAGFVASIYQRGIDFIQIPTTLLAQVDSSVGGKVAVNHSQGKNLIGAFHQPRMVIIDTRTLHTLDDRNYIAGLGEVVKYGIIYDKDFFAFLEKNADKIRQKEEECIANLIYHACRIKGDIVARDEKESGLRAVLNLGHTFGHSIEKLGEYHTYRHGEAVAMGTMAAAYLALEKGLMDEQEIVRIRSLYGKLGLPMKFARLDPADIYAGMLNDKKVKNNKLYLVLPHGIGNYFITAEINENQIIKAIEKAQEG
ncbi:MAG: 3-dehydroquinate synthase [Syntrophomonadaceae bacterium]|nr:3-dehydroquinate synthase [Syntrophomonadaceae bacterium]MDD4548786.1 3-dehydroquinate synthase [Syntrophomonadaceae bacterium]